MYRGRGRSSGRVDHLAHPRPLAWPRFFSDKRREVLWPQLCFFIDFLAEGKQLECQVQGPFMPASLMLSLIKA